jgi:formylmethanofuran dehydrogenase subunit A
MRNEKIFSVVRGASWETMKRYSSAKQIARAVNMFRHESFDTGSGPTKWADPM